MRNYTHKVSSELIMSAEKKMLPRSFLHHTEYQKITQTFCAFREFLVLVFGLMLCFFFFFFVSFLL